MGEREIADTLVSEYEAALAAHPKKPMRLSLADRIESALRERAAEELEEAARDIVSREKNESPAEFLYVRAARLREGRRDG